MTKKRKTRIRFDLTAETIAKGIYLNNLEEIDIEKFKAAQQFIRSCKEVILYEHEKTIHGGHADFLFSELLSEALTTCQPLVEAGDLDIASRIPFWEKILEKASGKYGNILRLGPQQA